jgi:hypothetical protein
MKKRTRRSLLLSVALVGLCAGVALAGPGPGGYTDGDPDHPHFMKPSGKHGKAASPEVGGSATAGASNRALPDTSSGLLDRALKAYLSVARYFVL